VAVRRRVALAGLGIIVTLVLAGLLENVSVWRSADRVCSQFRLGMRVAEALRIVDAERLGDFALYSAADCLKLSHKAVPPYTWLGGPCILGLQKLHSYWWWISDAEISSQLIFGADNRLADMRAQSVRTLPTLTCFRAGQ
jgi:hypothetical protein